MQKKYQKNINETNTLFITLKIFIKYNIKEY